MLSMRGGFILGLMFCLAAGPAAAQGWMPERPPAEFAKPYVGRLNVVWVPLRQIPQHCQNLKRAYACAYHNSTSCTLYIPDNVPSAMMLKLYVHELAHCNGWRHPQDMRYLIDAALKRAKTSPLCQDKPKPEGCP